MMYKANWIEYEYMLPLSCSTSSLTVALLRYVHLYIADRYSLFALHRNDEC